MKDNLKWKNVRRFLPRSFFNVWVMNGKRKCKAWFDAPNNIWYLDEKDMFNSTELHKVIKWAEIEGCSIEKQQKDLDESFKCL